MTRANYDTLDLEQVIYIHERIIEAAGGKQGVRDYTELHSGLERCKAAFGGEDLYPTIIEKVASLMHSLVMNHAFLDGNKRSAFAVMVRFLNMNDCRVTASQEEIIRLCLAVDNEHWEVREIVKWLKRWVLEDRWSNVGVSI
jgi:death-on-curing protein